MTMTTKTCSKCHQTKPVECFSLRGGSKKGHRPRCKPCCNEDYREYRSRDPKGYAAKKRAGKYRIRFNLSIEQVEAMFAAANYSCEACGDHRDATYNGALVLDHDHACCPSERTCGNCIRGVLCTKCNVALGALNDDAARVAALLTYIGGGDG